MDAGVGGLVLARTQLPAAGLRAWRDTGEGECCRSEEGREGMESPSRGVEEWMGWRGTVGCVEAPLSCVVVNLASDHSVGMWHGHSFAFARIQVLAAVEGGVACHR